MSLHSLIFNPEKLSWAYQNRLNVSCLHCPFCKSRSNQKVKRYNTTRSLYYHIRLEHKNETRVDFIISLLHNLSFALELKMIK